MNLEITQKLRALLLGARALQEAMNRSRASAPSDTVWKYTGYRAFIRKYNALAQEATKVLVTNLPLNQFDEEKIPGVHDSNAFHQQELFESVYVELSVFIAALEHAIGANTDEIQSLRDFFQNNLRRAIFEVPEREKTVQDAIESLLVGRGLSRGIDYLREQGRVPVSIKEVVPDFVIPRLSLAIEIKLSKDRAKSKEIVDQINADIQAYGKGYRALLFIVYDLGTIQDEAAFKLGLEKTENMIHLIVVKQ